MTGALQIDEIGEHDALARLEPEWWALRERSPGATPFQSPAWLIAWWKAFAPGRLMTLTVRDDRGLIAVAPLYLEDGPLGRRILPMGISLSDYIDVLVDPNAPNGADAIVYHLSRHRERWDAWEMAGLGTDAAALALPCPDDCSDASENGETCPVLLLADGSDDAGSHPAIPAAQRRKLRMARHRIARRQDAKIVAGRELAPRDWMRALVELHTHRWEERGEPGVLADLRVQAFHGEAVGSLIERGIARLFGLVIGSDIAGVYYGFSDRGRAYAYLGGFDPRFAYYSPGTVLLGHAIEHALREGVREFHFLRGGEAYKYAWGAVDRLTLTRTFVRNTDRA